MSLGVRRQQLRSQTAYFFNIQKIFEPQIAFKIIFEWTWLWVKPMLHIPACEFAWVKLPPYMSVLSAINRKSSITSDFSHLSSRNRFSYFERGADIDNMISLIHWFTRSLLRSLCDKFTSSLCNNSALYLRLQCFLRVSPSCLWRLAVFRAGSAGRTHHSGWPDLARQPRSRTSTPSSGTRWKTSPSRRVSERAAHIFQDQ